MEEEVLYLENIVKPLVINPLNIRVERTLDEKGVLLNLVVQKDDVGKVIGNKGETARAIRRLMRVYGASRNQRISLRVNDPENASSQS